MNIVLIYLRPAVLMAMQIGSSLRVVETSTVRFQQCSLIGDKPEQQAYSMAS